MLDKNQYVFIVGAGASKPYGFPTGSELYEKVKGNVQRYAEEFIANPIPSIPYDPYEIRRNANELCEALRLTSGTSIDKYLNINNRYYEIGVRATISAILESEKNSTIPINRSINGDDDWYSYLFRKMTEGLDSVNDLLYIYNNKVSFITFNYDRSLEYYLYTNYKGLLINSGITEERIDECMNKIKFIHIYGQTGYLPWQDKNDQRTVEYGTWKRSVYETATKIYELIDLMYSSRMNNVDLQVARELINNADRVLFLGFGYDTKNLELLGFPKDNNSHPMIYGTAYGQTENEIKHNSKKILQGSPKCQLFDCNSTYLLRQYLV